MDQVAPMLIMLFLGGLYFLPYLTAITRDHIDSASIFVLNLFLGWTFFGWVIALVWAFKNNEQRRWR